MRVITGSARGRHLETPAGMDVRPTTDVVKEAVFSIIQFSVEGASFLDGFAGSGQMGIEALSRGARRAVFVDNSRRSLQTADRNLTLCGLKDRASLVPGDTLAYLERRKESFDIIFLDPPYGTGLLQKAAARCAGVLSPGGIVLCEHPEQEVLPEKAHGLELVKTYRYGRIRISVLKKEEETE